MSHLRSDFRHGLIPLRIMTFFLMMCFSVSGQSKFDGVTRLLEAKKKVLGGNICMLVFTDNRLVYEKNIGKYNRHTPEMIASSSKWLTAALIATFFDEGKLSPQDTIGKYLPVFTRHGKGNITISQCMSHTTGIDDGPITLRKLLEKRKLESLADEVDALAEKPMVGKPGEVFCYGNAGLNIAGRIIEVITNQSFESLFQERIARPLGMKHTTFLSTNSINPSGGAVSTAADYMNFLQMILGDGVFRGKQIIRPLTIAMMQQSRTGNIKIEYSPAEAANLEYGWGEWVLEKNRAGKSIVVCSPGLFGTYPWVDFKRKYAAIVFVKNIQFRDRQENYGQIRDAVNKVMDQ